MPQPVPVDLGAVLLTAALNPAVPIVAFWMGRNADQAQKLLVAAFAAAVIGSVVIYIAVRLGLAGTAAVGRAAAGIFTVQFLLGLVWAFAGYKLRRRP